MVICEALQHVFTRKYSTRLYNHLSGLLNLRIEWKPKATEHPTQSDSNWNRLQAWVLEGQGERHVQITANIRTSIRVFRG
jgi:hypothetical protein